MCIHDKSMPMTVMEIYHLIAALPLFKNDKVHVYQIHNCWIQLSKLEEIDNDHLYKYCGKDHLPPTRVTNAKFVSAGLPFCSKFQSDKLTKEEISKAFEKAKRYSAIADLQPKKYKDFGARYEEAKSLGPDTFPTGIDPKNIEFKIAESCWSRCQKKSGFRKKCHGEIYFPIKSHEGIHFTYVSCRSCKKENSFYCAICNNGKSQGVLLILQLSK